MTGVCDIPPVSIEIHNGIAVVSVENPPVNAVSHSVREGVVAAVEKIDADPAVDAAVLICAGRTFVAGADIKEFGKPPRAPGLSDVISRLAASPKPWVAAIHGAALGGGAELALGCSYRVGLQGAKIGFPEVNLGLLPGAGGTVRLPYLIGAEAALNMIASGKPMSLDAARGCGLVDAVLRGICNITRLHLREGFVPPSARAQFWIVRDQ